MKSKVRCTTTSRSYAKNSPFIYQVTIHGYYNPNVSCALIYTDIYQAATREEAIGMAVDKVNRCYPLMMIKGNGIKCSLLNPIAL